GGEGRGDGLRPCRRSGRRHPRPQRPRRVGDRRRLPIIPAAPHGLPRGHHHRHRHRRGRPPCGRHRAGRGVRRRRRRGQPEHHGRPGRAPRLQRARGRLPHLRPGPRGHLPPPGPDHDLPHHHRFGDDPRPRDRRREPDRRRPWRRLRWGGL
ncbi:MAG: TrkA-like protein, partial [uncultured Thermomicrobiales bacterium]